MAGEYPNISEDNYPPKERADQEYQKAYAEELKAHTSAMMKVYLATDLKGDELWIEFIPTLTSTEIRTWTSEETSNWAALRNRRGVELSKRRRK